MERSIESRNLEVVCTEQVDPWKEQVDPWKLQLAWSAAGRARSLEKRIGTHCGTGRPWRASIYELNLRSILGQSTGATPVGEGAPSIVIESSILPMSRIVAAGSAMDACAPRSLEELWSIALNPGFERIRMNGGFFDTSLHGRMVRLLEWRCPLA